MRSASTGSTWLLAGIATTLTVPRGPSCAWPASPTTQRPQARDNDNERLRWLSRTDKVGIRLEKECHGIAGGYYRVGPTWKRPTKQGTNPLLSMDGMVQAITFENGRADFRNRWVRTPKYLLEDKHQRGMFAWTDGAFHDWRYFDYGDV